jgi:hypothetical protein
MRDVALEKPLVRVDLCGQEIRDVEHIATRAEALADTFLFGERVSHNDSQADLLLDAGYAVRAKPNRSE